MTNIIWTTPATKRHQFENDFSSLVDTYVDSYEGGQPIMSWDSNNILPEIHKDFLNHLPSDVNDRINFLLANLKN